MAFSIYENRKGIFTAYDFNIHTISPMASNLFINKKNSIPNTKEHFYWNYEHKKIGFFYIRGPLQEWYEKLPKNFHVVL